MEIRYNHFVYGVDNREPPYGVINAKNNTVKYVITTSFIELENAKIILSISFIQMNLFINLPHKSIFRTQTVIPLKTPKRRRNDEIPMTDARLSAELESGIPNRYTTRNPLNTENISVIDVVIFLSVSSLMNDNFSIYLLLH